MDNKTSQLKDKTMYYKEPFKSDVEVEGKYFMCWTKVDESPGSLQIDILSETKIEQIKF